MAINGERAMRMAADIRTKGEDINPPKAKPIHMMILSWHLRFFLRPPRTKYSIEGEQNIPITPKRTTSISRRGIPITMNRMINRVLIRYGCLLGSLWLYY